MSVMLYTATQVYDEIVTSVLLLLTIRHNSCTQVIKPKKEHFCERFTILQSITSHMISEFKFLKYPVVFIFWLFTFPSLFTQQLRWEDGCPALTIPSVGL